MQSKIILKNSSLVQKSFGLLSSSEKRRLFFLTLVQAALAVMDILGVLSLGFAANLSLSESQTEKLNSSESHLISLIPGSGIRGKLVFLIIFSVTMLVGKTIFSFFITRSILKTLGRTSASISKIIFAKVLSKPSFMLGTTPVQDTLYSVARGVEYITLQLIAATILMAADLVLLFLMFLTFLFIDPLMALFILFIFSLTGAVLYIFMHSRIGNLGDKSAKINIEGNQRIIDTFGLYRELHVSNMLKKYAEKFGETRDDLAEINAELNFAPYVSKYLIESVFILFALVVGVVQYYLKGLNPAITTIVLFLAAGTRLAPAVLRIQQGAIQLRGAVGLASPTFALLEKIGNASGKLDSISIPDLKYLGFSGSISIVNVSHTFSIDSAPVLNTVSLDIIDGQQVAIVGPSGAGKTTLVEIIMGLISPTEGTVKISNVSPPNAISQWPGAIAYVPQFVYVANASLRDNLLLGRDNDAISDSLLQTAIKDSGLSEFVSRQTLGADVLIGESGIHLSGGERQRLGIARALLTKPRVLVFDEATSALDGGTEGLISETIKSIKGNVTILMVAHRLSTVRDADLVVYLEKGSLRAYGSFEEVRNMVPDFDIQAKLMGL
jgi:ABC-type multidrug transport system fused ATPase/permease subunit